MYLVNNCCIIITAIGYNCIITTAVRTVNSVSGLVLFQFSLVHQYFNNTSSRPRALLVKSPFSVSLLINLN